MTAVLFWEWMQGVDHVRPLSRVVATIIDAVNKDRNRIRKVDLHLSEKDVIDAFKEAGDCLSPCDVVHPLNDGYRLVVQRSSGSFYGIMRVERPWSRSTHVLGESWWWSAEVSV